MTKSEIRKKLKNAPKYPHEWNGSQPQKAETKPDRTSVTGGQNETIRTVSAHYA